MFLLTLLLFLRYLLNSRMDKPSTTKEEQGSLRVKVTYTKDLIFPSETYHQFLDGIINSSAKNVSFNIRF